MRSCSAPVGDVVPGFEGARGVDRERDVELLDRVDDVVEAVRRGGALGNGFLLTFSFRWFALTLGRVRLMPRLPRRRLPDEMLPDRRGLPLLLGRGVGLRRLPFCLLICTLSCVGICHFSIHLPWQIYALVCVAPGSHFTYRLAQIRLHKAIQIAINH